MKERGLGHQRADGRYQRGFRMGGKRYTVYGKTQKELIENEIKKREEIKRGLDKYNNPTIAEYYERWTDRRIDTVKETTIKTQQMIFKVLSEVTIPSRKDPNRKLGDIKLYELTVDDLVYLQKALKGKLSAKTINRYMSHLGNCLRDAERERLFPDNYNPMRGIRPLKDNSEAARNTYHRALTKEETQKFFESEKCKNCYYYNVFRFAICTGMRVGEIGALKYSDIYDGFIHVSRTVTKSFAARNVIGEDAKTKAGQRNIPINEQLQEIIDYQMELNEINFGTPESDDELLFRNPSGKIMDSTPLSRHVRAICEECGIEPVTMHAFRSTFATRAIEQHVDLKTLQELLGHSDFKITMSLYGHCMDDTKKEEMDRFRISF